jgi:hypothetical protein
MAKSLTDLYKEATEEAQAANEERYQQAMGIANQIVNMYSPTGSFGQGYKASLERAKSQSVSSGLASLVQSGLGASGGAASLATAWEQGVGAEARLKLEDLLTEKQATALQNKISLIQSKEDIYPDYSQLSQAAAASSSAPRLTTGGFDMDQPFGGGYTYGSLGGRTSGGTSGGTSTAGAAQPSTSQSDAWWKWWNEMKALEEQPATPTVDTTAFTGVSQNVPTEEEDWWNNFYGW